MALLAGRLSNRMSGGADVLARLARDAGRCTIGELIQDRAEAAHEIRRLLAEIDKARTQWRGLSIATDRPHTQIPAAPQVGTLLRLRDVCDRLSLSKATVHRWVRDGKFPQPIWIGDNSVRWSHDDIEGWRRDCAGR